MVTNHGKEQSPHGHRDLTPVVWAILVMGMSSFHQAITNCTDQKKISLYLFKPNQPAVVSQHC
jgi:hypothetical protein